MSIYDKASLVLIPSGTKTSKVYSQKPTSGDGDFTFSRSTAATRVNADGVIEKETQNLLLQSNNFGNTWNNVNTSETSGQSGYDGSSVMLGESILIVVLQQTNHSICYCFKWSPYGFFLCKGRNSFNSADWNFYSIKAVMLYSL